MMIFIRASFLLLAIISNYATASLPPVSECSIAPQISSRLTSTRHELSIKPDFEKNTYEASIRINIISVEEAKLEEPKLFSRLFRRTKKQDEQPQSNGMVLITKLNQSQILLRADHSLHIKDVHFNDLGQLDGDAPDATIPSHTIGISSIQQDRAEQQMIVNLNNDFGPNRLGQLYIDFEGPIRSDNLGVHSVSIDKSGKLVVASFNEEQGSKFAWPSLVESNPRTKSSYRLRLENIPEDLQAISNTQGWEFDGDRSFQWTPVMRDASFGFLIGRFEQVSAHTVDVLTKVGISTPPELNLSRKGQLEMLNAAVDAINTMKHHSGIDYPSASLNIVILPELEKRVDSKLGILMLDHSFVSRNIGEDGKLSAELIHIIVEGIVKQSVTDNIDLVWFRSIALNKALAKWYAKELVGKIMTEEQVNYQLVENSPASSSDKMIQKIADSMTSGKFLEVLKDYSKAHRTRNHRVDLWDMIEENTDEATQKEIEQSLDQVRAAESNR